MRTIHTKFGLVAAAALLLAATPARARHDVHISYCQSQVTGNVFTGRVSYYRDDFLRALTAWRGPLAGLTPQQLTAAMTSFVAAHFRITDGRQAMPWTRMTMGENDKSVWFDVRAEASHRLQTATIVHTVLFKEYNDQMNLMVLKSAGEEHNYIFTPSTPSISVQL